MTHKVKGVAAYLLISVSKHIHCSPDFLHYTWQAPYNSAGIPLARMAQADLTPP